MPRNAPSALRLEPMMINCPICRVSIDPSDVLCRNSHFVGYPNHRAALAERDALLERYRTAKNDCATRNVSTLLDRLEVIAVRSKPVIAMSFEACDGVFRSRKYLNYSQSVGANLRGPARPVDHADRTSVGARLFASYNQHIAYAALSPDGRGLSSYGKVMVSWRVTRDYLGKRISLLEENSYVFHERHGLGRLGSAPPAGYFSTWHDRAKLVGAKLGPRLTISTDRAELNTLLLRAGDNRDDDDFVEIMIYADKGIDTHDVSRVLIQIAPSTPEEHHRRAILQESCYAQGVEYVES